MSDPSSPRPSRPALDGPPPERPLPPVTEIGVATLVLIVIGGIYLAAHVPRPAPLGLPIGLVCGAGALLLANGVLLSRVDGFAWVKFRTVAGWALLAYVVIAGMIGYVFVLDGTAGGTLAVALLMLTVFGLDVPLLLAFSVARYQTVGAGPAD
jgi:hypothetical protein